MFGESTATGLKISICVNHGIYLRRLDIPHCVLFEIVLQYLEYPNLSGNGTVWGDPQGQSVYQCFRTLYSLWKRTIANGLRGTIATLCKGSANAVSTLESNVAELNAIEEYFYVETPAEQALRGEPDRNLKTPRVNFVCRSSDDGKSELFRRIHSMY